jgi:hypothetical protein
MRRHPVLVDLVPCSQPKEMSQMWAILDDIIESIQDEQDQLDQSEELADTSPADRRQEFSSAE